jgi:hypothetical protein
MEPSGLPGSRQDLMFGVHFENHTFLQPPYMKLINFASDVTKKLKRETNQR